MRKKKFSPFLLVFLSFLVVSFVMHAQNTIMLPNVDRAATDSPTTLTSSVHYHWDPPIEQGVTSFGFDVAIGDVNNDGFNDIVTASFGENDTAIRIWNDAAGDWNPILRKDIGYRQASVFIGDANNDGFQDIVTGNWDNNNITILLWNNLTLMWDPQIDLAAGSFVSSVFVGDANNDGFNDIVTANVAGNNVSIFLWNNVSLTWDAEFTQLVGTAPWEVFIADSNNNGFNDIVTANGDDDSVSILLWNNGSSTWNSQITRGVGPEPGGVSVADANNDGFNDIITSNFNGDNVSILQWNNNTLNWENPINRTVGNAPESVYVADANDDGFNDIVTADSLDYNVSVLLWDNDTLDWALRVTLAGVNTTSYATIGDVNNDGYNDIVASNYWRQQTSIFLWNPAPKKPFFYDILPVVDDDGVVNLNWTDMETATSYYVYRSTTFIGVGTNISQLTPIANVTTSNYTDTFSSYLENDWYYYAIVAANTVGNSTHSNGEDVHLAIQPPAPVLEPISPAVDDDGYIFLNWSWVENATYSIYRDTSFFNSTGGLIPIAYVLDENTTNYTDQVTSNGMYYYAVKAVSGASSNLSECRSVQVNIPEEPIPGFESLLVGLTLITLVIIFARRRKLPLMPKL